MNTARSQTRAWKYPPHGKSEGESKSTGGGSSQRKSKHVQFLSEGNRPRTVSADSKMTQPCKMTKSTYPMHPVWYETIVLREEADCLQRMREVVQRKEEEVLRREEKLKHWEEELRKLGIDPGDSSAETERQSITSEVLSSHESPSPSIASSVDPAFRHGRMKPAQKESPSSHKQKKSAYAVSSGVKSVSTGKTLPSTRRRSVKTKEGPPREGRGSTQSHSSHLGIVGVPNSQQTGVDIKSSFTTLDEVTLLEQSLIGTPDWYIQLSPKEIDILSSLRSVVAEAFKALVVQFEVKKEEWIQRVNRVRSKMQKLGVFLNKRHIVRALNDSGPDAVHFLVAIYALLHEHDDASLNDERKSSSVSEKSMVDLFQPGSHTSASEVRSDSGQPYNMPQEIPRGGYTKRDRILLTIMATLQFPATTQTLESILNKMEEDHLEMLRKKEENKKKKQIDPELAKKHQGFRGTNLMGRRMSDVERQYLNMLHKARTAKVKSPYLYPLPFAKFEQKDLH